MDEGQLLDAPRAPTRDADRTYGRSHMESSHSDPVIEVVRLRRLVETKTHILSHVAHELGTPLSSLLLYIDRLQAGGLSDEARHEALTVLDRNLKRFGRMVYVLQRMSRIEHEALAVQASPTELNPLVDQVVATLAPLAAERQVRLMAGARPTCAAFVDGGQITDVLYNLISNAVKFTGPGGEVAVRVWEAGDKVHVEVRDTGIGLSLAQQKNLFRAFTRLHDGPRDAQVTTTGNGLGLYLSRGIVEAHGGHLWCQSDGIGQGCRFTFTVPGVTLAQRILLRRTD